ncbi:MULTISPECIES: hypothetical protein [Microbacterium]|uniref:Uncharacterized protein n=1 Tax=Microbacterium hominis TaxID=162426 RepID=A0A2K9D949_9MICO|nr:MULTISPECIES: hypothetical protein [Microbacterium]AUG30130.1 hypothetical protein CXR34_12185 [Microbacterium hominis]QOC25842.1 hypothetical protein IC745_16310 [Microbacterium hominis]QOC29826.1 hypothetical protein IC744_05650 [Microbacterium hominis]QYF97784.1 hypothetical protein KY498_00510 [Microbacterium sp. PAMC21962]
MVCIVAFIVVLVLSAVSAKYRRLLGKAWGCAWRRVTLRPCDTTFRDDVKNSLLAPLAVRAPRLVRPASIAIEVVAWIMVLSLIVSLYLLGRSGLNLFVYGTCDKQNAQACTLAAQACSIDAVEPGFWESIGTGDVLGAFGREFASVGDTIATVPSRLRTWDAEDFASPDATYLGGRVDGRPTALDVLDPGCRFCAELFRNMREAGFDETHNVTYLVYPIRGGFGDKFANSHLIATYLTAVRAFEAQRTAADAAADTAEVETGDWFILEQLFTTETADGQPTQEWMNAASAEAATARLHEWLGLDGYTPAQIEQIAQLTTSPEVAASLAHTRDVVEDQIRTVSIPSLIAGGGLHAGLMDVDTLRGLG